MYWVNLLQLNLSLYFVTKGCKVRVVQYFTYTQIVVEREPETHVLGTHDMRWRNGFKASWTRLFCNFCQVFGMFDEFCNAFSVLHFEKSSNRPKNLQKNEEKPCSNSQLTNLMVCNLSNINYLLTLIKYNF